MRFTVKTLQRMLCTRRAALFLLWLACIPVSLADPWHQFGNQDAYWHHGSGWIFPRHIGPFELVRSPYQIDGNDDVGAEYEMMVDGVRRTAEVAIYYPNSAAAGAKLDTAKAAIQSGANQGKLALESERKLAIKLRPEIVGVQVIYSSQGDAGGIDRGLYFFQASNWIVTIRTTTEAVDTHARQAMNEFVQAQRWDTLGTDSGRYHDEH